MVIFASGSAAAAWKWNLQDALGARTLSIFVSFVIAVAVIYFLAEADLKSWKIVRPLVALVQRRSTVVTERFLNSLMRQAGAGVGFCIIATLVAIFLKDYVAAWICLATSTVIAMHLGLTFYRVKHGFFCSNRIEAQELIAFIINRTADRRIPPGTPLANSPTAHQSQAVQSHSGAIGVRVNE
jgi:hypothetical protein